MGALKYNKKIFQKNIYRQGVTLLELIIVVAILGALASAAIPMYDEYVAESRKPEGQLILRSIADGAVSYYEAEHTFSLEGGGLGVSSHQFPSSTGATADALGGMPYKTAFGKKKNPNSPDIIAKLNTPPWRELKLKIASPFWYSYNYQAGDGRGTQYANDAKAKDSKIYGNSHFVATSGACLTRSCKDRNSATGTFDEPCDSGYLIIGGPHGGVSHIIDNSNWKFETDCGKARISTVSKNTQLKELWEQI